MKFVTLEELEKKVENNGVSGQDGKSTWYTIYYTDGTEEDIYTKE